ncbi:uridine kinase [Clostridium homopropionicum DSM 5847]|uniref:Uridine kinase n=1 Tax=Clostridium homopropionicum DSM 5847 TaxID=1121318 RepID=A0A0L6Z8B4_9CLOT|nr:hypothetical protein [Clostridium homopropionicum]KOA19205.1 uridine kinase [Clostridium homopropionicum DSM 5847]SFG17348.1 uridine kinase [Clostridium homopropionicum]
MDSILAEIQKNVYHNKNYVVGIDGGTGAGKSTLVHSLQCQLEKLGLNTITLHIDDFIHKRNVRYDNSKEEWLCFYNLQWRYDYLTNEILIPAKTNQDINKNIEIYNKQIDEYKNISIIAKAPYIVILEGIFLQRKELEKFLDYTIFIDIPRKERLKRILIRDTYIGDAEEIIDKYERRYFPAEDYYIKKYNPMKSDDIIYKISD